MLRCNSYTFVMHSETLLMFNPLMILVKNTFGQLLNYCEKVLSHLTCHALINKSMMRN